MGCVPGCLAGCSIIASALFFLPSAAAAAQGRTARSYGVVELDQQSNYSHLRVRKQGSVRTLMFVRDSGEEYIQSMVNMNRPHELLSTYCRAMFASYLVQPCPRRVLIVGLGGARWSISSSITTRTSR